jgi:peptidoglycan/LPS O-acetylase OafA/YrhL
LLHVTFCVYAFFAICVFRLLSVWLEVYQFVVQGNWTNDDALRTSIVTFFPALAGPAALQLVFTHEVSKPLRAFAVLTGAGLAILATVLQLHKGMPVRYVYPLAVSACAIAIWFWLVATGQDPAFNDGIDIDAPVGGSSDVTPPGDLTGFKV